MKKKFVTLIVVVIAVLTVLLWIIKTQVGDIRPALFPSNQDLIETIEKVGDEPSFPLQLSDGFKIGVFAKDLGKARDLEISPGGVILLSLLSEGKIVALPDKDGDGRVDNVTSVLTNLENPHGIAFHENKLFVAEETKITRYTWDESSLKATLDKTLFDLPPGGRHVTRSIDISSDGKLFVSLGSTCDTCFEKQNWIGTVVVSDIDGKDPKVFAKGLRNSVFITLKPKSNKLWGTEMGRDFLGDNLPPDEVNIISEGNDYGWPTCYGTKVHDEKFDHEHVLRECENTQSPVYNIAAHSAPLGLTFIESVQFPESWQGDLLVAYHGSWNRSKPVGYEVVRLKIDGDKVTGEEKFLTGFLQDSEGLGRPVDMIFDRKGSLYISDDKVGAVYKVSKQ